MEVARTGKGIEDDGGAVFDVTKFQLDYLTTPSGFLDIGIDYGKTDITTRTRQTDELYIIAYPHFNVNGVSSLTRHSMYSVYNFKLQSQPTMTCSSIGWPKLEICRPCCCSDMSGATHSLLSAAILRLTAKIQQRKFCSPAPSLPATKPLQPLVPPAPPAPGS